MSTTDTNNNNSGNNGGAAGNSTNAGAPFVVLRLANGAALRLRYTYNAIVAFEGLTGRTFSQAIMRLTRNDIGLTDIRALVWAGLLWDARRNPYPPDKVGAMLDGTDIGDIIRPAVTAAIGAAFGVKDADAADGDNISGAVSSALIPGADTDDVNP